MTMIRSLLSTWFTPPSITAAPPPTTGAPPVKEPKEIYAPSLGNRAAVYLAPPALTAGGYALGVGRAFGAAVVGGAVGAVSGAALGFLIGGAMDLIHNKEYRYKGVIVGGLLGTAGGLVFSNLLPPIAGGVGLAAVTGLVGFTISAVARKSAQEKRERAVSEALAAGEVSVVPFIDKIAKEKGANSPQARPMLEAFRALESTGWRFGDARSAFEYGLNTTSGYSYGVHIKSPAGHLGDMPADAVPALHYLMGKGSLADVADQQLVDRLAAYLDQGRTLVKGYDDPRSAHRPVDTEERALQAAAAFGALKHNERLTTRQDGLSFKVDAKTAADLDAAMKTVDETTAKFQSIFGPALAAGRLDPEQRQEIMEAAVSSPLGAAMDRPGKLLADLNDCWFHPGDNVREHTRHTLGLFRQLGQGDQGHVDLEQAISLIVKLQARLTPEDCLKAIHHLRESQPDLEPAQADRYQKDFVRLLTATGDTATAVSIAHIAHTVSPDTAEPHIAMLEVLAAASAAQPGYHGTVVDYATLLAAHDPAESLDKDGARYGRLLQGLAAAKQAEEAAPTYAYLRSATRRGILSGGMDDAVTQFLNRIAAGDTPPAARQALAPAADGITVPTADLEKLLGAEDARRATEMLQLMAPDAAQAHLQILQDIGRATPDETPEQRNLMVNYATLMAGRDPSVPLAETAKAFCLLLRGLHDMGQSQEAAPTYLFLRENQVRGRFAGRTLEDLSDQFLTIMFNARDAHRARQSMILQTDISKGGGVEQGDTEVKIGGVSIPIRKREPAAQG